MVRHPPDILITTPESLYLMLTSQAREIFEGAEQVIVDEIHAVAQTKRGAHLALTLERLAEQAGSDLQRIGLSATQNPLEEVGRFLVGPKRTCTIVDTGTRKPLDLKIHVPVEIDGRAGAVRPRPRPVRRAGGDAQVDLAGDLPRAAQGGARAPLDDHLRQQPPRVRAAGAAAQRARRGADRARPPRLARARGAADRRGAAQGRRAALPGRDLVARARHRHGRGRPRAAGRVAEVGDRRAAAHRPLRPRRGRHRQGPHLPQVPRRPARVRGRREAHARGPDRAHRRPAQPARRAGAADRRDGGVASRPWASTSCTRSSRARTRSPSSRAPSSRTCSTCSTAATRRRSSASCARGSSGTASAARSARARAPARWRSRTPGTIPDRGLFSVNLPDGRRVGELDEEMVYEARPGQVFLLGASSWRIEEITRDRVVVTPAPGVPGAVPFWKGDGVGRPRELGEAIGAFARWAVDQDAATLADGYDLDPLAAQNLLAFLREQQDATRVVPSDRTIVVERFRDEIGDWRLCVLSPYGGRVHAAWGLALSARIREEYGLESDAIWSDDGIIVHLPDADEAPGAELVMLDPDELEDIVVGELGGSALFGARFRENAGRALLIPRAYPGRRTPLWQQRLKSQTLLEVAKRYGQFPIVLETYRECLRDVLDVPGLQDLLRKLHARELSVVEVETATASPFASSLLFDYVATYMYEGDTPNAERRAAALALDRDLLRELLGQEELRDLIDPGALETVEADLQRISERTRADSADALHDVLRRIGDLTLDELRARAVPRRRRRGMARPARRRAPGDRPARRRRAALGGGRGRRALSRRARGGAAGRAPRPRSSRTFPTRWSGWCAAGRARTARSRGGSCATATGSTSRRCWPGSSAPASWCAASCAPAARSASGATPRCCGGCGAPRSRRCGPRSSPPTSARWRASRRAGRASTAIRRPARGSTGCARSSCRSRASRCPPRCGSATCCRGARAPTRPPGSTSCARRARSSGSAPGRSAGAAARWRSTSARTRRCSDRRRARAATARTPSPSARTSRSARGCGRARASSPTCSSTSPASRPRSCRRRSGTSSGPARRRTTRSRRCARHAGASGASRRARSARGGGASAPGAPAPSRRSRAAGR